MSDFAADYDHRDDRLRELDMERLEQAEWEWWAAYDRVAERCDVTERGTSAVLPATAGTDGGCAPGGGGPRPANPRSVTSQDRRAA